MTRLVAMRWIWTPDATRTHEEIGALLRRVSRNLRADDVACEALMVFADASAVSMLAIADGLDAEPFLAAVEPFVSPLQVPLHVTRDSNVEALLAKTAHPYAIGAHLMTAVGLEMLESDSDWRGDTRELLGSWKASTGALSSIFAKHSEYFRALDGMAFWTLAARQHPVSYKPCFEVLADILVRLGPDHGDQKDVGTVPVRPTNIEP